MSRQGKKIMKNKIAFKLTFYILIVVLISTLTVGVLFIEMFKSYTFENRATLMMDRAKNISELLVSSMDGTGQLRGVGGLMRFIDTMSEADVWILNAQGEVTQITGMGMMGGNEGLIGNSDPLPAEAKGVIDEVLLGHESTSRGFSGVYNEATLSVAAPILGSDGMTLGAVLLHSPITGITDTTNKALTTLVISILLALILAAIVAGFFSRAISKPLLLMNSAAREMAGGNFLIRTKVKSKDEVGQLSQSLDMLAWELGNTMEELEKQEKMRQDFVANVSHEFRTPLTIIQGSLEALLDSAITDEAEKEDFIRRMLSETKSLERLVKDLLDLSKLQIGSSSLNLERLNLDEITQDVVKSMESIAGKKGMTILLEKPQENLSIQGDYDRIVQLLKIFLDNSIKFGFKDSIIKLSVINEGESAIKIIIEDQGSGIAEEDLPHIWDRFYKGEKSRTKKNSDGMGLGLSIAKSIVDAHGGELRIDSILDKGTTVKILLRNM